jgi:hypothetical protein
MTYKLAKIPGCPNGPLSRGLNGSEQGPGYGGPKKPEVVGDDDVFDPQRGRHLSLPTFDGDHAFLGASVY